MCKLRLVPHAMYCPIVMFFQKIKLKPARKNLVTYSQNKLNVLGTAMLSLCNPKNDSKERKKNDLKYTEEFVVVEDGLKPLIGAKTAQRMKLVTVQHQNIPPLNTEKIEAPKKLKERADTLTENKVLSDYSDLFTVLGLIEGKLHLEVDDLVVPPRRVPIAVKGKLKEELNRVEGLGVFAREEKPRAWVSGLVTTMKPNGKV